MRLTEFKEKYEKLIGLLYGELNDRQKQTVYAMELYCDSQDALIGCDIYAASDFDPEYIDEQLRNTFQYENTTSISSK